MGSRWVVLAANPDPVGGWLELGRCVRKGERVPRVPAPVRVKGRDERSPETGE
jgi:hypothetical protein